MRDPFGLDITAKICDRLIRIEAKTAHDQRKGETIERRRVRLTGGPL
jgi:hypothetical protein